MRVTRVLRTSAGIAVLLLLAVIGVALIPPYVANWKLQRFVNELIDDPQTAAQSPELVRDKIVARASELGLPVRPDNVRITRLERAIRVDVLYLVHVDLAVYSVDLHFRPAAGGS